jgi:peptidoglycan hydrolase-like protein with peptidoglycan-binding domain
MLKKTLLASAVLATMAGFALANYQQGTIAYQEGRYVSAYVEFKESAQNGHAAAQYMLGRLYQEGRGIDRDLVQAYAWYDVSALGGYSPAGAARDALAPQLTAGQLQTATTLATQFRNSGGLADSGTVTAPTPAAAYVPPYSVRNVQTALSQLGYSPGPIDGIMGSKTRAAIRAYQIDSGLPVSGEPSVSLHEHLQTALTGPSTPAPSAPSGPSPTLISEVQAELRLRGYNVPYISGSLDEATVAAIKRYQSDASLTVDGRVSDTLLAQLRSGRTDPGVDYRAQVKSVQQTLSAKGYDPGPADGALGPRTRGAIRAYQVANGLSASGAIDATLLSSLGIAGGTAPSGGTAGTTLIAAIEGELVERNYAAGVIDGVLDRQARNAIAAFQEDAGLSVTGQASQTLLDRLRTSSIRNESNETSYMVWQVEELLDDRGYRVGTLDGTLDSETREGIEDFQKDANLKVTGNVNNRLLAALQQGGDNDDDDAMVNTLSPRQVWELEVRLDARGYNVGPVDKVADSRTHAGVLAYQKDEGLPATGRLDESLLRRLQQADASQQRNWDDLSSQEKGLMIMQGLLNSFSQ